MGHSEDLLAAEEEMEKSISCVITQANIYSLMLPISLIRQTNYMLSCYGMGISKPSSLTILKLYFMFKCRLWDPRHPIEPLPINAISWGFIPSSKVCALVCKTIVMYVLNLPKLWVFSCISLHPKIKGFFFLSYTFPVICAEINYKNLRNSHV